MRTPTPWILPSWPATRAELLAFGVTAEMLRTRLTSGQLITLRRGVYLSASAWPSDPVGQHLVRARGELARYPDAAMSHQTAALVWGLPTPRGPGWAERDVALTLPSPVRGSRAPGVRRRNGPLPLAQVERTGDGCRVTSPARTAVDLAVGLDLPGGLALLDAAARLIVGSLVGAAVRRRDFANARLAQAACDLLAEAAVTIRAARLAPVLALVDPRHESVAESLSAGHLEQAGIPRPICQPRIQVSGGVVFPDFYWAERGLIGEVDGAVKYATADAYVLEKEREQLLRDQGYRIVRWLAKEIMFKPAEVIDRVARAGDF